MMEGWAGGYDRTDSDVCAVTGRGSMNDTEARIVKMLRARAARLREEVGAMRLIGRAAFLNRAMELERAACAIERGEHRSIEL